MWDSSPAAQVSQTARVSCAGDTQRSRTDAVTRQLSDNRVGSAGTHTCEIHSNVVDIDVQL